ncbi:MAG: hydrolase 1, exosortase A system-associated, partial [Candidatus Binatia bacterium]
MFDCDGERLIGIVHRPRVSGSRGVVLIVGGPQYRVGSHRQFILLARDLARRGIPVLRFDYRGMGDSEGDRRDFEDIGSDIKAAIDCLFSEINALERVVLWGLCDAASAALFYAHHDSRITGLILLNPWVRSEAGLARVYMRHYYLSRLRNRDFWIQTFTNRRKLRSAIGSLLANSLKVFPDFTAWRSSEDNTERQTEDRESSRSLALRMEDGLRKFENRVL